MKLEGKRVFLREWKKSDVPRMVELCREPLIQKFTTVPRNYKKKDAFGYLKKIAVDKRKKSGFHFAIVFREKNLVIGSISIACIDKKDNRAELGYFLDKDFRGKGIMPEASGLILDFAFNNLKLHRITINCRPTNKSSKRVIKKLGAKYEGLNRDFRFVYGEYRDVLCFSILDREFKKRKKK